MNAKYRQRSLWQENGCHYWTHYESRDQSGDYGMTQLSACSTVLLERPIVPSLTQDIPAFIEPECSLPVLTKAHHFSLA